MALTVSQAFTELHDRQGLTVIQRSTASTREAALRSFFSTNFDMNESLFAIGSYKRGTICRGERDIDLMAPLAPFGNAKYWERYKDDSREFLYWVRDRLNTRYHSTTVSSKRVCVKLDFTDIVTDVTPCFPRQGGGYLMSNGSGGWMNTNPPFHANLMATADITLGRKLKPMVRLMKAWNIANSHHLSSFHMELMVKEIHSGVIRSHAVEIEYTLRHLQNLVPKRFDDPWPDGQRIDSYLSASKRDTILSILESDAKRAGEALAYERAGKVREAFERWAIIYGHTFPAYG